MFGYVDVILVAGPTLTYPPKQRGRQVDLNQRNLPLILSTLAKNIIIVSANDAKLGLSFAACNNIRKGELFVIVQECTQQQNVG